MNRIFVGLILLLPFATKTYSQGDIDFHPHLSTGAVEYSFDSVSEISFPVGDPSILPGFGSLTIAFMAAPNGTPLNLDINGRPIFTSAWAQASTVIHTIANTPGLVPATHLTLPASAGPGGGFDELSIVAWTGTATTWQDAINGGATMLGWTGSQLSGGALEWSQLTANPNTIPPSAPVSVSTGPTAYKSLVLTPVPDASPTLLLAGLAFVGLAAFQVSTRCSKSSISKRA